MQERHNATEAGSTAMERVARSRSHQAISAATLAAHNRVTSINHQPVELARARKLVAREAQVEALPKVIEKVEKDQLYTLCALRSWKANSKLASRERLRMQQHQAWRRLVSSGLFENNGSMGSGMYGATRRYS